jgi:hypothetical protein
MRCAIFASTLLLAALASTPFAQDNPGQDSGLEIKTSTDMDQLFEIYKAAHGGAERFDGVNYLEFDFTPWFLDEQGERIALPTRHIQTRFRDNANEQLQRSMRIETAFELPGENDTVRKISVISVVTETDINIWRKEADGEFIKSESRELKLSAVQDAKVLFAQLDMLLYLDSRDLRCTYGGVLTRDKVSYATAEAAFRPEREVMEPVRLYFDLKTALIKRIDVFDPKTKMRVGSTLVDDYKDHEGLKFPESISFVDRSMESLAGWDFRDVKVNPELSPETFLKP